MIYHGAKTREISVPLGGIGTGSVGLSGNGRLIDWELFGRPNKGGMNGFSFFAVKAEAEGRVVDARVLHSQLPPPYQGERDDHRFAGLGFGPYRETLAGAPHFDDLTMRVDYPFATLDFQDATFPGDVRLEAFNPLIPLNDRDSTIPAALFEITLTNTTLAPLAYTACFALANPFTEGKGRNAYDDADGLRCLTLGSTHACDEIAYGELVAAIDAQDTSHQTHWYRGGWFDDLSVFWHDFTSPGRFKERRYDPDSAAAHRDTGTLAAHVTLAPGQTQRVRFVMAWRFPNASNYWSPEKDVEKPTLWMHYYATLFASARDAARYALANWQTLHAQSRLFADALCDSTLPPEIIDAVSANISILKATTCLRLEDGSFYAFEGVHSHEGSCEGSCTHVWNYAYALPFLFPALERSMRTLHYRYNQMPGGGMAFRLQLPVGRAPWDFRPCCDGQFGDVMKTYRDWKISGDTQWLRGIWESVKRSIDFAWSPDNEDRWDFDKDGVLEGRQHHTLDMELFGPNAWLTGMYLGALKAGAEMAAHLGDTKKAQEYDALFQRGKRAVDAQLFNGSYYYQDIDLTDERILTPYMDGTKPMGVGSTLRDVYWDEPAGELKYQVGEGCGIDQVLAQWHANISGLGRIFDADKTLSALRAIYRHNYLPSLRGHFNPARLYAVNNEGGTLIFSWPNGRRRPLVPAPYSEETWSGCEYQAAAHMIQEGMVQEGLTLTRTVRDRYDGEKRNPFNEMECGSNYARSMASYSLLLAYSGFSFDMTRQAIGFAPVQQDGFFRCFFSVDAGWGTVEITPEQTTLRVLYGTLTLQQVSLPADVTAVQLDGAAVPLTSGTGGATFAAPVAVAAGHALCLAHR